MAILISATANAVVESSSNYITVTVTLSEVALDAVTVRYRTLLAGTAGEEDLFGTSTGGNYNGTVTFLAGETTKTISIQTTGDSLDEVDEHVVIELFDPSQGSFASGHATERVTGIILDDDGAGSNLAVFVSDPVVVEGDSGTRVATFEVKLSRPAPNAFTLNYATKDGSAQAGSDYVAASGTLSFASGQQVAYVSVTINGDTAIEVSEQFSLVVTGGSGVPALNYAGAVGVATILDDDSVTTGPVISISQGAAVVENSSHYIRFIVTLSEPHNDAVTVNYRTLLAGTASEGDLFSPSTSTNYHNGTFTFAAGETSGSIFVQTTNDATDEVDEHVVVELFNPVGGSLAGGEPVLRASGVILDDDGAGSNLAVFVSDPVLVEGDAGSKLAVFEVRLSRAATTAFNLDYATRDGSAQAGSDYLATSGTLTFAVGQDTAYVTVVVNGDTVAEHTEQFFLAVTPGAGAPAINLAGAVGAATILDDDASGTVPTISISAGSAVIENSSNYVRFVVSLSEAKNDAVTVNYRTLLAGTAAEGDFFGTSTGANYNGTVTFAAGETSKSIYIQTTSDSLDEVDEHFTLELFQPGGAVFAGNAPVLRASGVILDNNGAGSNLAVFVSDPVLVEGDSGSRLAVFEVRLSQPAAASFQLSYDTRDGSAQAGSDYVATSGTLSFATGQDVAYVTVAVNGDTVSEHTEQFFLIVSPGPGAPVINYTGAVGAATLLDDDTGSGPVISISAGSAVVESSSHYVRFVVSLSEATNDAVTVNYRTLLAGTAGEDDFFGTSVGSNYNGTVTFAAGETSKSIYIQTTGDSLDEADEHFTLELFHPNGAAFAGGSPVLRASGVILDDDGVGSNLAVFVSDPVLVEGDSGSRTALFEVRLSQPAPSALSMSYTTIDGTAHAGSDYGAVSGTLDFAVGQDVAYVAVEVFGDTLQEASEFFQLVVTPPVNPVVNTLGAVGTALILDDDRASGLPTLTISGGEGVVENSSNYVRFVVTLSEASAQAVTASYFIMEGSASTADYSTSGHSGLLTFAPGETSKSIFIQTTGDSLDERDEDLHLVLYNAVNAELADQARSLDGPEGYVSRHGFILDDDGPGLNTQLVMEHTRIGGSDGPLGEVVLRLSRPSTQAITFDLTTAENGGGSAGVHYMLLDESVTFAPGQTVAVVRVAALGDHTGFAERGFALHATPASGPYPAGGYINPALVAITRGFAAGTAGDDVLIGSAGADVLYGLAGNDTLRAWAGHDTFFGGDGSDTVSFAGWSSGVNIRLDVATAQAVAGGSVTLSSIENIQGGNGNDTLRGSNGNNVLKGGNGNDTFIAWAGHDTFDGEVGTDTASFAGWASGVNIRLDVATAQVVAGGSVTLISIENIQGGNGNDTLRGSNGNNVLKGGNGNDTFIAWAGHDTFDGEVGTDTVSFAGWASGVNIRLDVATAQVVAGGSVTLVSIENIQGGNGNDTLRGSNGDNVLKGGNGNDTFQAWAGYDTFDGEDGTDTVSFAGWTSGVNIRLDVATAQVVAGGSVTLANIENIQGGNGNDTLRGSNGDNMLKGGNGNDTFQAWLGHDTFDGEGGTDTVSFVGWGSGVTINLGLSGAQAVAGGSVTLASIENVTGGNGNDTLIGNADANVITGGRGRDILTGNGGADTFRFVSLADSSLVAGQHDVITDFDVAGGDLIDLSAIDAITGGANDAFVFLEGDGAAFTAAGQVRFRTEGGNTFVEANTGGDSAPDLIIQLTGIKVLTAEDFIL